RPRARRQDRARARAARPRAGRRRRLRRRRAQRSRHHAARRERRRRPPDRARSLPVARSGAMRGLRRAAVGLAIAALAVAPAGAAAPPMPVERLRSETAAGVAFALGGTLVSALASGVDGALWLL